jgi:sporulation protein YunB
MENKLYTRRRLKFKPIKKMNKFTRKKFIKLLVFIIILVIIGSTISFIISAYPIFKASCETTASSLSVNIINSETTSIMKDYTYDELVIIDKDNNGKINFIQTNSGKINEIMSKIAVRVQDRLDNVPRTEVFINLGSVTGISILKYIGPKFNIELEAAGSIESKLKTEFVSVGINQTLHKVYLDVSTQVGILTPFGTFGNPVETRILLTESVIVGEVPSTYYDFNGETEEDIVFETMQ